MEKAEAKESYPVKTDSLPIDQGENADDKDFGGGLLHSVDLC